MRPTPGADLPTELEAVAQRLRAERREATPLELDAIKTRVLARGRPRSERSRRRTRILVPLVALSILAGATGGVIAGTSGNHSGSAAKHQYQPGKGCGDKNHRHQREDECKKPPK